MKTRIEKAFEKQADTVLNNIERFSGDAKIPDETGELDPSLKAEIAIYKQSINHAGLPPEGIKAAEESLANAVSPASNLAQIREKIALLGSGEKAYWELYNRATKAGLPNIPNRKEATNLLEVAKKQANERNGNVRTR